MDIRRRAEAPLAVLGRAVRVPGYSGDGSLRGVPRARLEHVLPGQSDVVAAAGRHHSDRHLPRRRPGRRRLHDRRRYQRSRGTSHRYDNNWLSKYISIFVSPWSRSLLIGRPNMLYHYAYSSIFMCT